MSVAVWCGVVALGGCGAVLRFLVDAAVGLRIGRAFPYGTLVVNLSGAAVLGLFTGLALTGDAELLAGTATIGSYTTFSTWVFESQRLVEERRLRSAGGNLMLSLALGLGAAAFGRWIGGQL